MKELKPAILAYIQYLSLPQNEKQKKYGYTTKSDFAKANNVAHTTLNRWEKVEGFKEKLEELQKKSLDKPEEKMRAIFKNLEAKAVGGDSKAIEIYMKNLPLIKEILLENVPSWEELISMIDSIENNQKFRKKKIEL